MRPGRRAKRAIDVTSNEANGDLCGPFAQHGYLGIETQVTDKIVAWMKAHGARESPR